MFFFKRRKKVQTQQQPSEPAPESLCVTTVLTPEKTSILEIANLQGLGQREQQQDAKHAPGRGALVEQPLRPDRWCVVWLRHHGSPAFCVS